jgi:hypothetical protein
MLCALAGCSQVEQAPAAPLRPDTLIVLPGAEDVNYRDDYDGAVSYILREPHPAASTREQIRSRLEGQGWRPIADDLMNPGEKNSHERGWSRFIDGTRNNEWVYVWSGAWENSGGDRVEYWFEYRYPWTRVRETPDRDFRSPLST